MHSLSFLLFALAFFCIPLIPAFRELRHPTDGLGLAVTTGNDADASDAVQSLLTPAGHVRSNLTPLELAAVSAAFVGSPESTTARHLLSSETLTLAQDERAESVTAPEVIVKSDVVAPARISAPVRVQVGVGVSLQMVQSAKIEVGEVTDEMHAWSSPSTPTCYDELVGATHYPEARWWRKDGDVTVLESTNIDGNIIAQGNVVVGKNARVHGSIKAQGSVTLAESAFVHGNVLGHDVCLHTGARVQGSVIAQGELVCGGHTVIGTPQYPASLLADTAVLHAPVLVYGGITAVGVCLTM
jgi:hypothetical protein